MSKNTAFHKAQSTGTSQSSLKFNPVDELFDLLERNSRSLAEEFLPMLPTDKHCSILDVGCGYGPLLYALKQHGYENASGIDASADQVDLAHKVGLMGVKQFDALEYLRNSKQHYDVILAIDLIEHFNKNELLQLLEAMRGVLRPGGIVILRTPNIDAPFGTTRSFGDFRHELHLNKLAALELFERLNFSAVDVIPSPLKSGRLPQKVARSIIWTVLRPFLKTMIFAAGLRQRDLILTPHMVIRLER